MSTINALKKEVDLLHKALNIKAKVPEWKQRSTDIQALLKEYDTLTEQEKEKQTQETYEWYKREVKQP